MGYKCCVPGCKSNYKGDTQIKACFAFPKDSEMKKRWLSIIPRKNFIPTQYSKVCELHFIEADILKETSFFDEKKGKLITVPLKKFKLTESAIPSIFPNLPHYLSRKHTIREDPEDRLLKIESQNIDRAIEESLISYDIHVKTCEYSSVAQLLNLLNGKTLPAGWSYIHDIDKVIFLKMKYSPAPEISMSLTISEFSLVFFKVLI